MALAATRPLDGRCIASAKPTVPSEEVASSLVVQAGQAFGRYLVIEEVGRGAMGIVLRAYDKTLQREVALKVMQAQWAGAGERMLHEAHAMAKLSHPNVVALYDAQPLPSLGDSVVVLAMEYVPGKTLRHWLRETKRAPSSILDAYLAAGRGLAAAHAAGVLHGDFKPDNVLVGDDGRVRVADFGLARTHDRATMVPLDEPPSHERHDDIIEAEVTQASRLIGTPAYSAPEQYDFLAPAPSSDQYAFCVALWEGLTGARPFDEATDAVDVEAKRVGPPPWPRNVVMPRQIVSAIIRGLDPDPSSRWPTLQDLLEALASGRMRRRSWILPAGIVAALGVSGASFAAWYEQRAERCSGAEAQIAGVWDAATREAIALAINGTGVGYAEGVGTRVEQQLDEYVSRWITMYDEACAATTIRAEQPPEVMDLKMACLRRAKVGLGAVAELFEHSDAQVVEKAHDVLTGLPALERCVDIEILQADVPPPEALSEAAVEQVQAEVARAAALRQAGKYAEALECIQGTIATADASGYEPVETHVLLELGLARAQLGAYAQAQSALRQALRLALRWKQTEEAQQAASHLVYATGALLVQPVEGLAYGETAAALLQPGDATGQATLSSHLGLAHEAQGDFRGAEAHMRAALVALVNALGPEHVHVATVRNNLVRTITDQGRYTEAEREARAALAAWEQALGPEHPSVATARLQVGYVLEARSQFADAEAEYRAALAALEKAVGPDHHLIASARLSLSAALGSRGQYAEAEVEARAALVLWEKTLEPDHPHIPNARNTLARTLVGLHRFAEAEEQGRLVIASWERTLGASHPHVAVARNNLGRLLLRQGRHHDAELEHRAAYSAMMTALGPDNSHTAIVRNALAESLAAQERHDEAVAEYRAVLDTWAKIEQPDPMRVAEARSGLALALLRIGEHVEALPLLEAAWEAWKSEPRVAAPFRAEVAFALAQALRANGRDRGRARSMARTADELYAQAGERAEAHRREVQAWLRGHG